MSTDPARWQRLQALFAEALALPAAEREGFVQRAAGDDTQLAIELRRLLAQDAAADADHSVHQAIARAAQQALAGERSGVLGRRFGAWRVVAHIADGGMGAVYRVERADGQYEQPAALKLLNPALISPQAAERLAQERQILARLAHPHIARLLDGGRGDDGAPWLVMEYVDGQPIDRWCHGQGLDTAARLRLFVQVCGAVDHAHRHFVVHRDLKPSNILVDTEGRPRLLDFGIARLLEPGDEAAAGLTRSGERVLTPSHASPEQVSGGAITTASDVYALGVLLYEVLTGQLPHEASSGNPAELARAIVERDPPRPSRAVTGSGDASTGGRRLAALQARGERLTPERLARELAGDLDNIVLMALRKEPARRYASAAELADDIERHLQHRPVRARPDTAGYRLRKLWQRHPVAVPATALALMLAAGGAGLFTWRLAEERDRALAAEAQAQAAAAFSAGVLARTAAQDSGEREVPVLTLLERAAERSGSELAGDPRVGAQVDLALGRALTSWGAYEQALRVLQRAHERSRSLGEPGLRAQAEALDAQSVALHDLGRLEPALALTREAAALWQRIGTPAERAESTLNIAMGLNSLRRRDEAEPVFREAIAQLRAAHGADHASTAFAINNLAWGLHARGRLQEAAPLYEEALAMQRRLGLNFADQGQTLNNLAGLYHDTGDIDRAEVLWREVKDGYEALFGPDGHPAVLRAYSMAAMVPLIRGAHEEALALTARAAEGNVRTLGERHRWTATTVHSHGFALLGAGRVPEAVVQLERAARLKREVLPPNHADHVPTLLALGRAALAQGRLPAAERHLREAWRIVDGLPGAGRLRVDTMALVLGEVLARQGRPAEARAEAARAARLAAERFAAGDWRRLAVEARVALPPFEPQPAPEVRASAEATLEQLRQRLGSAAPLVRELEQALAAIR